MSEREIEAGAWVSVKGERGSFQVVEARNGEVLVYLPLDEEPQWVDASEVTFYAELGSETDY